ncbi:MAG: phosphate/phosphite/phosphonate ABC transporter substrate-binding protein [Gammaproteobacteria bacterium]|nr:MAG: phosphate/phosphite/phosphonate ABC transporter substrate-binding protein [Gammaproteobacteria bacterium]
MTFLYSGRVSLLLILTLLLTPPKVVATETFSFGIVPQFDARRTHKVWKPLLMRLEAETGLKFRIVGSSTIPEFETQFMAGEFDFAYMNPYHVLKAARSVGYMPLVRDVGRTLHGVIVVPNDSPITRVEELDGKVVAFPAPNALGASLIPRADFINVFGISIVPRYVQSHSSVYLNVALGETAAGGGVQKTLGQQPAEVRDTLRVLYRTRETAPHPLVAHPRVPERVRNAVRDGLLAIGATEEGRRLLEPIPIDRIGIATMADYRPMEAWGLDALYVQ